MTPNVVHFAVTLVASALVLAPRMSMRIDGADPRRRGAGGPQQRHPHLPRHRGVRQGAGAPPHWSDMPLYGVAPGALYVLLLADAGGDLDAAPASRPTRWRSC